MVDNDSGSEQRGSWQPPEYVSPWIPVAGSGGAAGADDASDSGNTIAFGAEEVATPAHGQPWYEQPGYQQPANQQPAYQQPAYQHPTYQHPWFGQPQGGYEQASFGQPGYGEPGYGQQGGYGGPSSPGGQYPWGGYGTPPPPQGSRFGRILAYVAVAALAAGVGAGAAIALNHSASSTPSAQSPQINTNPGTGTGGGQQNPAGGGAVGQQPGSHNGGGSSSGNNGNSGNSGTGPLNVQALANKVDPGIVDVTSTLKYNNATAEGTGMIITSSGLVLTNNHVIDEATSVSATLVVSGKTYAAQVVGYDSTDDVALLQLEGASGLKTVSLGDSSQVKVGQAVLALGNAGGRGGLPATAQGKVNGLNRTIQASDSGADTSETLHGMLEMNAPIQEGDSGGPLVNSAGKVIGMDTAANTSGGFDQSTIATTGFAIPINHAVSIASQIAAGHASATVHIGLAGFIGIGVGDASDPSTCSSQSQFGGGFVNNAPVNSGALICNVITGTPADAAGLTQGDVITSVNGQSVADSTALTTLLGGDHPGDQLTIVYVDGNGASHTTSVTLSAMAK